MPRRRQPEPPIYTFRVRILGGYDAPSKTTAVWRDIEVAANQTLADLGNAIPEAFAFDDTIEHEAWNRSDQMRIVLIFDVWNPHLSEAEQDQLTRLFAIADKGLVAPGV